MSFKRIAQDDVNVFEKIVGEERVLFGDDIPLEYSHDEMTPATVHPEAVVQVTKTSEVSEVMKHCWSRDIPVTPRGAGTGLMGGAVPVCEGLVLDMSSMNEILEIDQKNMVVRLQPGVTLMELAETVEERGLFYAPDPGEKSASIGGNVNTNAGGMRAVKYGVTRDHIRGMEVVLPDGETLQLGGRIAKNATGYQLMQLIIGSEGTLAIVTEIIAQLLPLPPFQSSLLVPFDSLDKAIDTVPRFAGVGITPQAIEFFRRGVIEASEEYLGKPFPDQQAPAYLLLRFDGSSKEELDVQIDAAGHVCLENGAIDALIADTPERQDALWDARGAFLEAVKYDEIDECDVVVPIANIAEMVNYADEVAEDVDLRIETFGHAGDGNMHINIVRNGLDYDEWRKRVDRAQDMIYEKADNLGGMVSGEHGIGHSKRQYFRKYADKRELQLMRQTKKQFDPKGILNPSKIL